VYAGPHRPVGNSQAAQTHQQRNLPTQSSALWVCSAGACENNKKGKYLNGLWWKGFGNRYIPLAFRDTDHSQDAKIYGIKCCKLTT